MKRATKTAENVIDLLHEDHRKVRDLFFQFREAEESAQRMSLVKEIITELYLHATAEEEIVYPAVSDEAEDAEDIVKEAETEHNVVKHLMAELSQMKDSEEDYDAKVTVLCELVDHHIREEEKEMFKKLSESGVDLEDLAEDVQNRKDQLKKEPLPEMKSTLEILPTNGNGHKKTTSRVKK